MRGRNVIDVNMDLHQPQLIADCLIHTFSFLPEEDLIRASAVCKVRSGITCGSSSCLKRASLSIRT